MNTSTRDTSSGRRPRTFELLGSEWVDRTPQGPRPPFWLLVPAALVALGTLALIAFGAIAALATAGLLAVRSAILRLFRR